MFEEIKLIIEKNLPEQVGDILKKTLEKAEQDAKAVDMLTKKVEDKARLLAEYEKRDSQYLETEKKLSEIEKREEALKEKERNLQIEELKFKLESEREKTEFVKSIASGLVRNTEYRRNVFDSKSYPASVDQFGGHRYATSSYNSEEKAIQE